MSATSAGGSVEPGTTPGVRVSWQTVLGASVLLALLIGGYALHLTPGFGPNAALSLMFGVALGITFQRGRFCFFCILRDFFEQREPTGLMAILMALAVAGVGYALVFGAFLPNPLAGRLPPEAHIGPVSWVLVVAGLAFGLGMVLSGACLSGHLYRLGEGYTRAPFALLGSLLGFGLGFFTWQTVYLTTLRTAPIVWLPATLGYGGALLLHLAVLGGLAILLLRFLPPPAVNPPVPHTVRTLVQRALTERWHPAVSGSLVGLIGVAAYFRIEPLGVTAQLGSLSRTALTDAGLLAGRLNGLDTFAGCATVVAQTITENGWLISGLALGSLAVVLLAGRFQLSALTVRGSLTALLGGGLMGWGAMLAFGCTVGTLLSGISAFALSGWVFGAAVIVGFWLGLRFKLAS